MNQLARASHSVSQMVLHLEWCTKYRNQAFADQRYKLLCEAAIMSAAERHKISILELAVMPDHVHVLVRIPMSMSASDALQVLKGYSSYAVLKLCPELRPKHFWGCDGVWSPGKFVRTVGDVDLQKTAEYVRNQPLHHAVQASGFSPR